MLSFWVSCFPLHNAHFLVIKESAVVDGNLAETGSSGFQRVLAGISVDGAKLIAVLKDSFDAAINHIIGDIFIGKEPNGDGGGVDVFRLSLVGMPVSFHAGCAAIALDISSSVREMKRTSTDRAMLA